MSSTSNLIDEAVYSRLEESILEHMDEDMVERFVPNIKRALCAELARRREAVTRVESLMQSLFPGEDYEEVE